MPSLPPGQVWLASYPKSGNTWMRVLLSNLLAGEEGPQDINGLALRSRIASARRPLEEAMLVDSVLLRPAELARARALLSPLDGHDPRAGDVKKVHDAYERLPDGEPVLGRGARCALYVLRDPRDVAVSLAAHNGSSLDRAIGTLCDPDARFEGSHQFLHHWGDWSGHAQSWLDQRDVPVHLVTYERLTEDPLAAFAAALDFLGVACGPEEIALAVRHADFSELSRQEARSGFKERPPRASAPFFRQGRAGAWVEALTPAQVQRIERAHGETMRRFGYAPVTI